MIVFAAVDSSYMYVDEETDFNFVTDWKLADLIINKIVNSNMALFQPPKTPLQKSMDILGKQLSFYSLCIIGE